MCRDSPAQYTSPCPESRSGGDSMAEEIINFSVSELAPRSLSDSGIVLTPPTFIFISMLVVTYNILCGSSGLDKHVVGNKSNVS